MPKVKVYQLEEGGDYGESMWQDVIDTDTGKYVYSVHDLSPYCPEDAIIGRDLKSAEDWLEYVRLGMQLAAQGYTDAVLKVRNDA